MKTKETPTFDLSEMEEANNVTYEQILTKLRNKIRKLMVKSSKEGVKPSDFSDIYFMFDKLEVIGYMSNLIVEEDDDIQEIEKPIDHTGNDLMGG